jgi:oligopeptide transport system ATP-binding protein
MTDQLLQIEDLKVHFPVRVMGGFFGTSRPLKAVDGVSLGLKSGETLGVVGESGCGKTTLGRAILRLAPYTSGAVSWIGEDFAAADIKKIQSIRRDLQIVFQDPLASLDPRMTAGDIIAEPVRNFEPGLSKSIIVERVRETMELVGLSPAMINRYPHEFSGGQCQRIGIARAIILAPKLIVCDEPVSALDVSIRAQIVNLLSSLQKRLGLAMLFISHDLSVVGHISQRVAVMYLGKIMEIGTRDHIFRSPRHPYTQALLSAVPVPDPDVERAKKRIILLGDPPSPLDPPSGCVFRTRCAKATDLCAKRAPSNESVAAGHQVACHHWKE